METGLSSPERWNCARERLPIRQPYPPYCPMPVRQRFDYSGQMARASAAIGFRLHTGWAALVVAAGRPGKVEVLLRRRFE